MHCSPAQTVALLGADLLPPTLYLQTAHTAVEDSSPPGTTVLAYLPYHSLYSCTPGHQHLPAAHQLCSTTSTPSHRLCTTSGTPCRRADPWTWPCPGRSSIKRKKVSIFICQFRFRQHSRLRGFLVQPNLVLHIGMVSSLTKNKDPLEFVGQIHG